MVDKRLTDPKNIADGKLSDFAEKLSYARAIMAQNPQKGGMPFIYAFAATKDHEIDDMYLPMTDEDGNKLKMETAATDGKRYKWSLNFLEKLTPREITWVMAHETYHIILQHCNIDRSYGKNPNIWNIAVDYIVNAAIEHDARQAGFISAYDADQAYRDRTKDHPVWKGNLGKPQTVKELLVEINKAFKNPQQTKKKAKKKIDDNTAEKIMYADYSVYGRSAESIYDEIMAAIKKAQQNGNGKGNNGKGMMSSKELTKLLSEMGIGNGSIDHHEKIEISKSQLLEQVLDAATSCLRLRGTVPAAIEEELKKLQEPKLKWQDIVRHAMQTKRQEKGKYNDWSRFRRRELSLGLYRPKKKDDSITWMAMLDTSGSMSNEDIVYAVSQLKVLDGRSKGYVVPCDAETYWDKMVEINSMEDLPSVKVVGKGGTAFHSFFENYQKHTREPIDLIIILSDGYFTTEDCKKPPCDVVFVITTDCKPEVKFGRVAPLRNI